MATDRNMKLLIVDDMANMRRTIRNMLRYIGYEYIEEANDGDACLKKANEFHPDFFILDWNMPRVSGMEVVQKAREGQQFANTPMLMVTAEVQEEQIAQAVENEVDGYIIKPFVALTLEEKINGILERRNSPTKFDRLIQDGIKLKKEEKYEKGEIFLENDHAEKAAAIFRESLRQKEDTHVYNRLGIALRRKGKVAEAIKEYQKALQLDPNDEALHYNIGRACIEARNKPQAIRHFKKALVINPNFNDAKTILRKLRN